MMMPTRPGAAFEVVQPQFLFPLLIIEFDAPASPRGADQTFEAELFRQVAQVILGRLRLLQRPLDQEPKRRPRLLTLLPMPSRLHAARPPARAQRSFGPFPPSEGTKLPLLLLPGHFLDRPR